MRGKKKKRFGLMQRISSWFEQLPLRRRRCSRQSENSNSWSQPHKRQSKSAAPRFHYNIDAIQTYNSRHSNNSRDHSVHISSQSMIANDQFHVVIPSSWNRQETETYLSHDNSKLGTTFLQSFSTPISYVRKNIRTNPWISRSRPSIQTCANPKMKSFNKLFRDHTASFHINSLDESTYSSGYGSQDSSPESSVHSPNWQPSIITGKRGRFEDKAVECNSIDVDEALGIDFESKSEMEDLKRINAEDQFHKNDEHLYYELERFELNNFNQFPLLLDERTCSSDSEIISSSDGSLRSSQCSSPIYAKPHHNYDHNPYYYSYECGKYDDDSVYEYPNVASSFTYIPCNSFRPPPEFHPPPPPAPLPPSEPRQTDDLEQVELDFLTELDAQIAELQMKSVQVRQLVDEARERRDARVRNAQIYHDLAELRRMKWVLQNHFELML